MSDTLASNRGSPPDSDRVDVTYEGQTIPARQRSRLLDAILEAGYEHRHVCGGHGFCTSCRVEIIGDAQGLSPVSPLERERLLGEAGRLRLACQAIVRGPVAIRVPPAAKSRFSSDGDET